MAIVSATTIAFGTLARTGRAAAVIAVLAMLAGGACRAAEPAPAPPPRVPADVARRVQLTKVVDGLDQPVALTFAPGDPQRRLFIVEKVGRIRILADGRLQPATSPFLDVHERVSTWSEQGLLGLAFDPDFAHTRRFYVNFTDRKGNTRVVEFATRADDRDHADPASEREILFVDQPYKNHNGGNLVFGPTASCTSASATAAPPAIRTATGRTTPRCSVRCCASTSTPSAAAGRGRSSSRRDSAIHGATASIARPAISGSPTSARIAGRRSTSCPRRRSSPARRP